MKRLTSKLVVLMMVLTMAFSLAACGSKDDASNSSTTNDNATNDNVTNEATTNDSSQSQSSADKSSSSSSSSYSSVEEYVNSPEIQNALSTLEKQLEGSGMNIKITADGNKMIYTYTYENQEKVDGLAESLEQALSAQDATFQATAEQIKEAVGVDSASVVIEYVDSKGEMIYSKEYTSK